MRFTLEIRCDNAAFTADDNDPDSTYNCDAEIARILRGIASKLESDPGCTRQTLRDSNGNRVGECGMEAGR